MIGVLCGGNQLPTLIAKELELTKKNACFVFLNGTIKEIKFPSITIGLGEVKKILNFLKSHKVEKVVFAGDIKRPTLSELNLDSVGMQWMAKLGMKFFSGDDSLLKGIINLFEAEGIKVIGVNEILNNVLVPEGILTTCQPNNDAFIDIKRGIEVAKALGAVDVGQSVIVQQGIVLGVEAAEGTNQLIERCGKLKHDGRGGVLVKISKPKQEKRIDLPTIGPDTIKLSATSGLIGIAVENNKTIIINSETTIKEANKLNMFIVGVNV